MTPVTSWASCHTLNAPATRSSDRPTASACSSPCWRASLPDQHTLLNRPMAKTGQEGPSRNEDEFFAKQDAELMKQMCAKLDKEREANERKAHWMKCPKCGGDLKEEDHGPAKVDV